MAQSLFQVGGNAGSALGPLLATFVLPRGQRSIARFSFVALLGIILLADIGAWVKRRRAATQAGLQTAPLTARVTPGHAAWDGAEPTANLPRKKVVWSVAIVASFRLAGIGAALLGKLADVTNISFVYHVCSFLPAVGILTALLPDLNPAERKSPR